MWHLIGAVVWVVCGALAYGFSFAYDQKEFPEYSKQLDRQDRKVALIFSLFGPIALIVFLIEHGAKHGLMYRSIHRGENPYDDSE